MESRSVLDNARRQRSIEEALIKRSINSRLLIICMAAAAVGLSMALISIAKLLLFVTAIFSFVKLQKPVLGRATVNTSYAPLFILGLLLILSASLLWTKSPLDEALNSLGKYGKLLIIAILVVMIRTRREAIYAVVSFLAFQILLMLGSWTLFFGIALPWATSNIATTQYSVFSSYLDQGIMGAVTAAVLWHLRGMAPTKTIKAFLVIMAAAAMANVLFVLQGRSGHVVAVALLSLAIMWELPKKLRPLVLVLPFVLVGVLYLTSDRVSNRLDMVVSEVRSFQTAETLTTSSGIRLTLWIRAVQMIAARPLAGYGPGNWNTQYNNDQLLKNPAQPVVTKNFNVHQEYLQWGVQLGLPGIGLFLGLMAVIFRDAVRMAPAESRATFSVLAAFAICCLFNSALYDAYIGDFFCVAFGLLLALGLDRSKGSKMVSASSPEAIQTAR